MSDTYEGFEERGLLRGVHGVAFVLIVTITMVMFLILIVRKCYLYKYQVDLCPSLAFSRHSKRRDQDGWAMTDEMQRQLDLERQDPNRIEAIRKDRREWYESYIKPFTMTVHSKDFFYARETDELGATILSENPQPVKTRKYSADSTDMYDEEELDEEFIQVTPSGTFVKPIICQEGDEKARLHLYLPVQGPDDTFRSVDAECAVCFCKYEEGDQVVWSNLECKHAFHYDCMMPWLVKGKKRCPMCRDWFVPATKIADQKKQLAERQERDSNRSTTETYGGDNSSRASGDSAEGDSAEREPSNSSRDDDNDQGTSITDTESRSIAEDGGNQTSV